MPKDELILNSAKTKINIDLILCNREEWLTKITVGKEK